MTRLECELSAAKATRHVKLVQQQFGHSATHDALQQEIDQITRRITWLEGQASMPSEHRVHWLRDTVKAGGD